MMPIVEEVLNNILSCSAVSYVFLQTSKNCSQHFINTTVHVYIGAANVCLHEDLNNDGCLKFNNLTFI